MNIEAVIEACREAGEAACLVRGSGIETKLDGTPVSQGDLRAHELLVQQLSPSGYPIISEEGEEIPEHKQGKAWVIDPIDGTSSYIRSEPNWAVMVALIENGQPVLGVVYAPDRGDLWYAEQGRGAFVERKNIRTRIFVSKTGLTENASMLLSLNHPSPVSLAVAEKLRVRTKRISGLGIKSCLIAEGTADLYWSEASLGEWDVCAPQIIVQEAGGSLNNGRGDPILYGSTDPKPVAGVAVANSLLSRQLAEAGKTVFGE